MSKLSKMYGLLKTYFIYFQVFSEWSVRFLAEQYAQEQRAQSERESSLEPEKKMRQTGTNFTGARIAEVKATFFTLWFFTALSILIDSFVFNVLQK